MVFLEISPIRQLYLKSFRFLTGAMRSTRNRSRTSFNGRYDFNMDLNQGASILGQHPPETQNQSKDIETLISEDVWGVVRDNYERGSYTTAIITLLQYVNEIVREKSGLSLDNTKLMDAAFLGQSPRLKVTKMQTQTEKDIQAGVGHLLKGLCLAVRNPRAHERYQDNKQVTDTIIQFVNYVLDFIRNSKQALLVEDWLEFVLDPNFNNQQKYSKVVVQEVPAKKRYELLVNIFRSRDRAKVGQLNSLVEELMLTITPEEHDEFIQNLNKELLQCSDDHELRMFLTLYPPQKWDLLVPITKLRIEHMVTKSLEQATMIDVYDDPFDASSWEHICNEAGMLSTFATKVVTHFDTKNNVLRLLGSKLADKNTESRTFVLRYYSEVVFGDDLTNSPALKYGVKKSLSYHDCDTFEQIEELIDLLEDAEVKAAFGTEFLSAKQYFEGQTPEAE